MLKGETKSALHFHGSKVISYGGHFVLCSEEFECRWGLGKTVKLRRGS